MKQPRSLYHLTFCSLSVSCFDTVVELSVVVLMIVMVVVVVVGLRLDRVVVTPDRNFGQRGDSHHENTKRLNHTDSPTRNDHPSLVLTTSDEIGFGRRYANTYPKNFGGIHIYTFQ